MRLAVCVDSVVLILREAVGGGSSLKDRSRLDGGGISSRWPAGREGGAGGLCLFSSGQLWKCMR